MKRNEMTAVRSQSVGELLSAIKAIRKDIQLLRLTKPDKKGTNVHVTQQKRIDLAHLLTIVREKELKI